MKWLILHKKKVTVYEGLARSINCKTPIVTIGTFDGMHVGHQKIIKQLIQIAKDLNGESVLLTFYPHPRSVINTETPIQLLQNQTEKIKKLEEIGLDKLVVIPFTDDFSKLSAIDFVQTILIDKLKCHSLVLGYDHHFGNNREGNLKFLLANAKKFDLNIIEIPAKEIDAIKISSTKIRGSLLQGDVETANLFLGYPYEITGEVVAGEQLGRTIGFPTANIALNDPNKLIPKHGVYAVKTNIHGKDVMGMLNIGVNPTVQNTSSIKLEVHLFDFSADLYHESITLQLINYIRPEHKFDSIDALTKQLKKDEIFVRDYFSMQ